MVRAGGVILAAGSSSRFGEPKQLLEDEGELLVHRAVRAAQDGGCNPVIVVTGEAHDSVTVAIADLHSLVIRNQNWAGGIGSSIRLGVEQLIDYEINAIVLLVCDQPAVDRDVVHALIAEHERSNLPIVVSRYADTFGVPALFHRSLFGELLQLPDERGAKMLIEKHQSRSSYVVFPNGVFDLDRPEDFVAWQRIRGRLRNR